MARDFGIYPDNREPVLWIGCRGIITKYGLDVPFDRWSSEFKYQQGKDDFIWWVNNIALPMIDLKLRERETKFVFFSENNLFYCEADSKESGGYLYVGFGSTQEYDDMIN